MAGRTGRGECMNGTVLIAGLFFAGWLGGGFGLYRAMVRQEARQARISRSLGAYALKITDHNDSINRSPAPVGRLGRGLHVMLYKVLNFQVAEAAISNNRAVLGVALGLLCLGLYPSFFLLGFLGLLVWGGLWVVLVRMFYANAGRRHVRKLGQQLPETIGILVRALRVGTPLNRAMQMVAVEASQPTAQEFQRVMQDVAMGRDLPVAFSAMSGRIGLPGYQFLAVVVDLQSESGGGLAEIMLGLEKTVRERMEIQKKGIAASGEAKMTSYVLLGLPIVVIVLLGFENHRYFSIFFTHPMGHYVLALAVGLWVAGLMSIRLLINRVTR